MKLNRGPRDRGVFSRLYWDLWLIAGLAVAMAGMALTPSMAGHPARVTLAIVYVLFVPGYAFLAALFPERGSSSGEDTVRSERISTAGNGIDGIERAAIAFGTSVALTALIALVMNFTPWGIRLVPIVAALTAFTLGNVFLAGVRRRRITIGASTCHADTPLSVGEDSGPTDTEPFVVPFDSLVPLFRDIQDELTGKNAESRLEMVLTIALVIAIVLAAGSVAWALSTPRPGSTYTEFYLLTLDDERGLVAGNYPTNFTTGTTEEIVLGINNHEFQTVTYTVAIRFRDPGDGRTRRMQTIRDIRIRHNRTWLRNLSITPPFAGDRLRLEFRLYRDGARDASPYRELHLMINVSEGNTMSQRETREPRTDIRSAGTMNHRRVDRHTA